MKPLHDPQPGALGFVTGEGAVCRLLFDDHESIVAPTDAENNLVNITANKPLGLIWPSVVHDGFTGPARRFSGHEGLRAEDPRAATYLPHSVTIQAIVRWDQNAQASAGEPGTLISRGLGNQPAQRRCFALYLRAGELPGEGWLEFAWQAPDGPLRTYPGAVFDHRAGWFLFTATREYIAPDRVLLRYWRNDALLAAHDIDTGQPGRIGGGVGSGKVVLIGASGGDNGRYQHYLHGDIDSLVVRPYAITSEEIDTQIRRLTFWQPQIHRALTDLLPPGRVPSRDPNRIAQRIIKATAQPLALAESRAEDLERNGLAPRCYGARLHQWEHCLALPTTYNVPIDARRARVQAALRRELGFTADGVRQGLAPLLQISPDDIELITVTNLIEDDFAGPLDEYTWQRRGNGTVTTADDLVLSASTGADIRHDASHENAAGVRAPLADASVSTVTTELASLTGPLGIEAGLYIQAGLDTFWFAVRMPSGGAQIGIRALQTGSLSAWIPLSSVQLPIWLRIQIWGSGDSALVRVSHSQQGPYTGYSTPINFPFSGPIVWSGCTVRHDSAALASNVEARFSRMLMWTPNADRPFHLYAYRDPSLPGHYDLAGARIQLGSQRAARDSVGVGTVRALVCDDVDHGCNNVPLAGYERITSSVTPGERFQTVTGLVASHLWNGRMIDEMQGAELVIDGTIELGTETSGLVSNNGMTEHSFMMIEGTSGALRAPTPALGDLGDQSLLFVLVLRVLSTPSTTRNLLGKREGSPYRGFELVLQASGVPFVRVDSGDKDARSALSAAIADHNWHTLVFAYRAKARTFQLANETTAGPSVLMPGTCTSNVHLSLGAARLASAHTQIAMLAICDGVQTESVSAHDVAQTIHNALISGA